METERDRDPGILISSVMDCVSDLVIQMSEDLAERAIDFAEKGKFLSPLRAHGVSMSVCHKVY